MQYDSCGMLLKKIHDAIVKHANNDFRKQGLTLTQARLLMELDESEGDKISLKELERRFDVAQPTIVGIVQRLEAKGLIISVTAPDDNRVKLVKLTASGKIFSETNKNEIAMMEKRLVSGLTKKEQQDFLRMLNNAYDNIK